MPTHAKSLCVVIMQSNNILNLQVNAGHNAKREREASNANYACTHNHL